MKPRMCPSPHCMPEWLQSQSVHCAKPPSYGEEFDESVPPEVLSLVHKITTEEPAALDEDTDQQLATLAMRLLQKRPAPSCLSCHICLGIIFDG